MRVTGLHWNALIQCQVNSERFAGPLRLSVQLTHVLNPYDDIAVKMVVKVKSSSANINAPNKAPNIATGI